MCADAGPQTTIASRSGSHSSRGSMLAEWTDQAGKPHREHVKRETTAVKLVARGQAGGLRFHDLRHSYATWLVDNGVPPNMVQRVMGHERASTTLDL
jgi:integrase